MECAPVPPEEPKVQTVCIRGLPEQDAAGPEQLPGPAERARRVENVLDDVTHADEVEGGGRTGKRRQVTDLDVQARRAGLLSRGIVGLESKQLPVPVTAQS